MLLNKKGYYFETLVLLTYETEIRHRVKAPSVIDKFYLCLQHIHELRSPTRGI